jgi:hypothetical protein
MRENMCVVRRAQGGGDRVTYMHEVSLFWTAWKWGRVMAL